MVIPNILHQCPGEVVMRLAKVLTREERINLEREIRKQLNSSSTRVTFHDVGRHATIVVGHVADSR